MHGAALIIGNIILVEHCVDGLAFHLVYCAENRGYSHEHAAIIGDAFHAFADGDACGDGGHQDNDMLTLDHWLDIVAENHLAIGVVFRRDHVDSAVSVHGEISGACKFLGEQSTDDLGAVQTDDGVHDSVRHIKACQRSGYRPGF